MHAILYGVAIISANQPVQAVTYEPTPPPQVSNNPTSFPTSYPTNMPTPRPTHNPTLYPTRKPTLYPTETPTDFPSTKVPSTSPTIHIIQNVSTSSPTLYSASTIVPSTAPSITPSSVPTSAPTPAPTSEPEIDWINYVLPAAGVLIGGCAVAGGIYCFRNRRQEAPPRPSLMGVELGDQVPPYMHEPQTAEEP